MNGKILFSIIMGLNLGIIFMNIPPALDELMIFYNISYTRISLLISALLWSHALMQVPAGMVTDRWGVRRTLILSLICMMFGHMLPIMFPPLELAILGRVIAGIGTGLSVASTMKLVALYAPGGRVGTYQAFFGGFFSIGSIVAYLLIPRLLPVGWQWVYILPLMTCLFLLAILGMLDLQSEYTRAFASLHLGKVFRVQEGWVLGVYHALSFGSILTLGNWVPSLLAEVWRDVTTAQYAWGGALIMLVSGIGRLSGGVILFRFRPLLIVNTSIVILFAVFLGIFVTPSPVLVLTLALLAAWFASVNFGALFHVASQITPPESYATMFGFINFLANMGAMVFTVMFGLMKDSTGTFTWGFAVLAFLCLSAYLTGRISFRKEKYEA
ncbi:MAG: MFS transporter [Deltaproteobacteria bacterium]|nr:MFS transporter [Deltaproteobacteria bacterium]